MSDLSASPSADGSTPPGTGYLDHASADPLHPEARAILEQALDRGYADPRRLHRPAREARLLLDNARAVVAESLGVRSDEVVFTPSGTHATHLGVLGLLGGRARVGDLLVTSGVEHSAVLQAARWHVGRGGRHVSLDVDPMGRVRVETVAAAFEEHGAPAVLALQSGNPEVGALQPVAEVGDLATKHAVPVFVDACATGGRLALPRGWSAAALSAHKWGGPAGVGVLLVRKSVRWRNPFPGDDRVEERSTGFENVPAALAAAAALQAVVRDRESEDARVRALVDSLARAVRSIPDVEVFHDDGPRLPHVLAFSCLYVDGEALVTELDRLGFAVASGSACTASTLEPSHVLAAMGALTHGNLRVSLGATTTAAEVERFATVLPGVVARLRAASGMPS